MRTTDICSIAERRTTDIFSVAETRTTHIFFVAEIRTTDIFFVAQTRATDIFFVAEIRTTDIFLVSFFKSGIAEHISHILIQVPTSESLKLDDLSQLNLSEEFLFVYQLHYLAKHSSDCSPLLEAFLIAHFDEIIPEARHLIVLLLNPERQNDQLVLSVLPRLYCVQAGHFSTRTIRRFWRVIGHFSMTIPPPILSTILIVSNPEFRELALVSQ
jgi:hypothetical protein